MEMTVWLVVWASAQFVSVMSSPQVSIEDNLRLLRGQVQALLEEKTRDAQIPSQLAALREEVGELRTGVRRLKNLETRLEWAEAGLTEVRSQGTEVSAALDKVRRSPKLGPQMTQLSHSLAQLTSRVDLLAAKAAAKQAEEEHDNGIHKIPVDESGGRGRRRRHEGLAKRVAALEAGSRRPALELLQSVENLESRLDTALPQLQRELSKTELSLAQLIQQSALVKQQQDNQRATVKALSEGLSALQNRLDRIERARRLENNQQAANIVHSTTTTTTTHKPEVEPTLNQSSVQNLFQDLSRVISDYRTILSHLPKHCSWGGEERSGLSVTGAQKPRLSACSQGWTIVQRRIDGRLSFDRTWEEYAQGFGHPSGEFWIGNEALHELTEGNRTRLRVEMEDIHGVSWWAEYTDFRVGSRESGYKLLVSGHSGNASDSLSYQSGAMFSAKDQDFDGSPGSHCAGDYGGGWWFSHCQRANLNGRFNLGMTWFQAPTNEWIAVSKSLIKLRPHP